MAAVPRIRQPPRVAEIVASRLRDDILSGRLREGDVLPSQESLFTEFGVSTRSARGDPHPRGRRFGVGAARQRGRCRRASAVGRPHRAHDQHGAAVTVVHPADVSGGALMHLEPICAGGMCAAREDRMSEVVPYLQAEIDRQEEQFDDTSQYVPNARRFFTRHWCPDAATSR